MAFERPSLPELCRRVELDISSRLSPYPHPQEGDVASVFGAALGAASHLLHGHLDWIAQQMLPITAAGDELDRHARTWLTVPRKPAAFAGGQATVSGSLPLVGDELRREDGVRYSVRAVAGNTVQLDALEPGLSGNAGAGAVLRYSGGTATVDSGGLAGGAVAESDEDLRERLLQRIRNPPMGGSVSDYIRWSLEVPGIARAWVKPNSGEINHVVVYVAGGDNIVPNSTLLDAVRQHLELLRPVTARVSVVAPRLKTVAHRIKVYPDTAAVRQAVENSLRLFYRREASLGSVIRISRISEAVSLAAGETHHMLLAPIADVVCEQDEIAVPGGISWT
ncbi:baseplate J/gp47 family protein [Neisseria bergeri]|uniref:baseplate J/gp47 family protein n=1 Tax=Neisseria bergeri TaxID=1906581 RepID=UPI00272D3257|nr:baseplate J/gp47 family protein [Neisseria bergeri]